MEDVDRNVFYTRIKELANDRAAPNSFILNATKYKRLMQQVRDAKTKVKKDPADYRRLKRYDIIRTASGERLAMSKLSGQKEQQIFVELDEMYDIIHSYHLKMNHAGRTRMMIAIKSKYKNITSRVVMLYLSLCQMCKAKVVKRHKTVSSPSVPGVPCEFIGSLKAGIEFTSTEPTDDDLGNSTKEDSVDEQESGRECLKIYSELFARGQFDIIDIATAQNECYKYLLVYRNLVTCFVHLKPLQRIKIDECVDALLDIFLVFGAPNILQSKNGQSVTDQVCRRMHTMCPELKVVSAEANVKYVHGKGHSNEYILKLLRDWLKKNPTQKWYQGLKFIQYTLNNMFIESICRTPSESVFGHCPKRGLASMMSKDEYSHIINEDEFRIALEEKETGKNCGDMLLEESLISSCNFIKLEQDIENESDEKFDIAE